ncbi:ATP-binding cassette domain-containing protein [Deferrisoma camini]|uniref:ATP-binding cassette domain-containing protein n=1 Tax=Deferrisoma camini TaxID=1035120 RepID=UPI00046D5E64|nr:ATP-binding cassette domain-containing protein [Deferrisoma camini]
MHIVLDDIHKRYGRVHANRGVSLEVRAGTIHGVLGENGAGKSTLMRILAGYTRPTSGRILLEGDEVRWRTPAEAVARGVGMLYQDPMDFLAMTALENYALGRPWVPARELRRDLEARAAELGFSVHPDMPLERLTVGERQQLELLRLLSLGVGVLILDEPTTGISGVQREILFSALRRLADEGRSVLLVSHKLEDVEALCDEITVLRQGAVAGRAERPFRTRELLEMMFGEPPAVPRKVAGAPGAPIVSFRDAWATGGRSGLRRCSVTIREGEVVGLAGVEGAGQNVFLRLAAGLSRPYRGAVEVCGAPPGGYRRLRERGVAFLPSGRLEEGLVQGLTVLDHFALGRPRIPFLAPWRGAEERAEGAIRRYRIRGEPGTPVEALSGGNQQRVLLALLPERPRLLLLESPTRGLDLESAHWVWEQLLAHKARGATIVFSSPELDEILMVAERVLVFHDGLLVADVAAAETSVAELGSAIAGKTAPSPARPAAPSATVEAP